MTAANLAMAPGQLFDRFEMFNATTAAFSFIIDGKIIGRFQSLEGLEVSIDMHEIYEGGNNHSTVKRPGRMEWSDLVLTRGITDFDTLFNWINDTSGDGFAAAPGPSMIGSGMTGKNKFDAHTGALTLHGSLGVPLRAWWVREALPIAWSGPSFSAAVGESVPMESLTIAHEGLVAIDLPTP